MVSEAVKMGRTPLSAPLTLSHGMLALVGGPRMKRKRVSSSEEVVGGSHAMLQESF